MSYTQQTLTPDYRTDCYDVPEVGTFFWHKQTKYFFLDQRRDFAEPRVAIRCINAETGHEAILFADELDPYGKR